MIKFYLKHHLGRGNVVFGFGPGLIRTLVSMATDSSHRLTMGKVYIKKNLLQRNHKAQSFHTLCVAMYSGPLYKSCQPCPCGLYRPHPEVSWENIKKNLLLRNYKAQSFHILYVVMCSLAVWPITFLINMLTALK